MIWLPIITPSGKAWPSAPATPQNDSVIKITVSTIWLSMLASHARTTSTRPMPCPARRANTVTFNVCDRPYEHRPANCIRAPCPRIRANWL